MGLKESGLRGSLRSVSTGVTDIPDSEADQKLAHRWVLDDVNGTVEDRAGSADGANNGVTSVSGDFAGGSAGDGDGTDDHINAGVIDPSDYIQTSATAFSIKTTDGSSKWIYGVLNSDRRRYWDCGLGVSDASEGELWFRWRDSNERRLRMYTDGTTLDDGSPHRVVINADGLSSPSDVSCYIDQNEVPLTVQDDETPLDSWNSFDRDFVFYARNPFGSIDDHIDAIIDDFCIFDDSLTDTEAESYINPWS